MRTTVAYGLRAPERFLGLIGPMLFLDGPIIHPSIYWKSCCYIGGYHIHTYSGCLPGNLKYIVIVFLF